MRIDKLVGERFKERPADCVIDSHAIMVRGGYMKYVAGGIYSQFPPLKRVLSKIEAILRREMDAIDGQEVLFPVVLPASLWEESGRYESVGQELARFSDRNKSRLVLGMTHEEAAVHLVREYGQSYARYPFMIYQIQTKFRDEARPRAGMIRVREFTMKDGYSFHTSKEDLEAYYARCHRAYERIFAIAGIPEVISVLSDSGMMGGSIAHEFMLLTPVGEDSIAICPECGYKANMEAAPSIIANEGCDTTEQRRVHTPGMKTMEEVCGFLGVALEKSVKAVVYQKNEDDAIVIAFLRGDIEVNETKLTNHLKAAIHPAQIDENSGICAGFIGVIGLSDKVTVVYDTSLAGLSGAVTGANETDYHITGFDMARDCPGAEFADIAKIKEGGTCPKCGKPAIAIKRGIEVGNIFQLGVKYTESMNMQYLDAEREMLRPIMGCYGIGVGRLAASVCEALHDEYGPIWPITIAPWQVSLCCVRVDDKQTKEFADSLYAQMQDAGIEVLYDDRNVRPGVMFSDADLIGAPIRVTVSPRNMEQGICELTTRDKSVNDKVPTSNILNAVRDLIEKMTLEITSKAPARI